LNGRGYKFICSDLRQKEWAYQEIHRLILDSSTSDLNDRVRQVFENYEIDFLKKTSDLALTWEQIRKMSEDPLVEIGAHTISHPALNKLTDSDVLKEIEGSRDKIESEINKKVEHFSWIQNFNNDQYSEYF